MVGLDDIKDALRVTFPHEEEEFFHNQEGLYPEKEDQEVLGIDQSDHYLKKKAALSVKALAEESPETGIVVFSRNPNDLLDLPIPQVVKLRSRSECNNEQPGASILSFLKKTRTKKAQ